MWCAMGFVLTSAVSNTQMLDPSDEDSFHHLNPTKSLPDTFLTFQKSAARSKTTRMKIMTLFFFFVSKMVLVQLPKLGLV